jgi:hypothetical protein
VQRGGNVGARCRRKWRRGAPTREPTVGDYEYTPLLGMSGDTSKTAECRAACRRNRCSAKRASKALGLNLGVLPDHPAQRDWVEGFFHECSESLC